MTATNRTVLLLGVLLAGVVVTGLVLLGGLRPQRPDAVGGGEDTTPVRRTARAPTGGRGEASLIGTLLIGDDEPAVGRTVLLEPADAAVLEVRTGPDGTLRFDELVPGRVHELRVLSSGHATVRIPGIVLDPGETRDVGELRLAPAVHVSIVVRDSAERPLFGAVVEAHVVPAWRRVDWNQRMAQLAAAPVPVTSATTDADGRVTLRSLATGQWTFVARKEGYASSGKTRVELRAGVEPDEVVIRLRPGHPLSGRVLDGEDRPLPGIAILSMGPGRLYDLSDAAIHSRVTSDEEGRYAFTAEPAGDRVLYVALEGWAPIPLVAVRVPEIGRIDLVIDLGGTLSGTVRAMKTDEPIAGATVRTWAMVRLGGTTVETVTDEDGRFSFGRLPSPRVSGLTCRAEGWTQAEGSIVGMMTVAAGEAVDRELVMRPGAVLRGVVTSDGAPLVEASVLAWFSNSQGWFGTRSTTTDAEGRYEFTTLVGGRTWIQVSKTGHYQAGSPRDWGSALREGKIPDRYGTEVPRDGEATFDLELLRGIAVSGRVEGPDGEPAAGARVSCPGAAGVMTDGAGEFRLAVAPGTKLRVFARKGDLLTRETTTVDVRPGEPVEGLVLRLAEAIKIRGRVVSASGKPLIDPRVTLHRGKAFRPRAFNIGSSSLGGYPVDADGWYEALGWATSGHFYIRAEAQGHAPTTSEPVALVPGQESYQVDLTLGPGEELRGRVTSEGDPVAGAEVSLDLTARNRKGPMPPWEQQNQQYQTIALTDADGGFSVAHLEPGACDVVVRAEGYVTGRIRARAPSAGEVAVALSRSLEIHGTVVYREGGPAAGLHVYTQAVHPDGRPDGNNQRATTATTRTDGSFVLTGLEKRHYRITAQPPWGNRDISATTARTDPVVPGGEPLRIVVERGESISGRVVDEAGRPVTGVQVSSYMRDGTTQPSWRTTPADAEGTFRLLGLKPGSHTIGVGSMRQGGSPYQPFSMPGVPTGTEGLELVLRTALEIEGQIVDESGKPVAAGEITAHPLPDADGRPRPVQQRQANLDDEGRFRLKGLSTGRYRLTLIVRRGRTQDTGWTILGGESLEAGQEGLRLTATRGLTISGVLRSGGRPVPNVSVRAATSEPGAKQHSAQTDENGRFSISGLRDGVRYMVIASPVNRQRVLVNEIPAGTKNLVLTLAEGLRVAGRVLDASGRPAANSNIYLDRGAETAWGRTNARGEFSIAGLSAGTYRFRVWNPQSRQMTTVGEVEAGETDLDLRLP